MGRLVSLGMVSPAQLNEYYYSPRKELERQEIPYYEDVSYK